MSDTIPTTWSEELLSTLLETLESGSRPKGGATELSGTISSYGGENIAMSDGMCFDSVKKVTQEFAGSMDKGILSNGDVLINKDGANTGKCGFYKQPKGESLATINEHLFLLRGMKSKVKQEYLYYSVCSVDFKEQLRRLITGSAQPGLNSKFVEYLKIPLPPLVEQEKIAEILTSVDDTIEHTQTQVAKLQDLKTATMNELLTKGIGHTEFRESELGLIPTTWEIKTLGDFGEIKNGINKAAEDFGSGTKLVNITDIYSRKLDIKNLGRVRTTEQDLSTYSLKPGNLLFVRSSVKLEGVAVPCVFQGDDEPVVFSGFLLRLEIIDDTVDSHYLKEYFLWSRTRRLIERVATKSANININQPALLGFKVLLPPLAEQEKIAEILTSLDDQIEAVESKLVQLESLKKSLMGDLLTGRVRVSMV